MTDTEVTQADRREADRLARGAAQVLPAGGLAAALARARLEDRPLRVKLGLDPTGDRLTLGHGVVLRTLRRFADAGHTAVLILGTVTGQVGDPSGRSATRPLLSAEVAGRHADGYLRQVLAVLGDEGVEVVRNGDWLGALTLPEVVAEARHLTVAQLVEREDVARRLAEGRPVSLSELLYPLLQAYDSVAVRADVELGGTDQTFNLLVGRELQRAHGQPPQVVLTVPLLVGTDGAAKMGKSLGNFVALDDPPAEQFGKVMSIPDHLVGDWALLCTDLPDDEVARLGADAAGGGPGAADAKRRLAHEVVRPAPRCGGRGRGVRGLRRALPGARGPRRRARARAGRGVGGAPARPAGRRRADLQPGRGPPPPGRRGGPSRRRARLGARRGGRRPGRPGPGPGAAPGGAPAPLTRAVRGSLVRRAAAGRPPGG